jgi:hypothetical protein
MCGRLVEVGTAKVVATKSADKLATAVFEAAAAGGAVDAVVLGGVERAGCGAWLLAIGGFLGV